MALDVKEEFRKIDEEEHRNLINSEPISKLLQIARSDTKEYQIGDQRIRVLAYIPKDQRRVVTKLRKLIKAKPDDEDEETLLDRSEELFYTFLSKMCPESPFNLPETWEYIDKETGVVPRIAIQIIELCSTDEARVAEFRPQQ